MLEGVIKGVFRGVLRGVHRGGRCLEGWSEVSLEGWLEGGLALGGERGTWREMFAEVVRCPQIPSEVSSEGRGGQWCPELSSEVFLDGS